MSMDRKEMCDLYDLMVYRDSFMAFGELTGEYTDLIGSKVYSLAMQKVIISSDISNAGTLVEVHPELIQFIDYFISRKLAEALRIESGLFNMRHYFERKEFVELISEDTMVRVRDAYMENVKNFWETCDTYFEGWKQSETEKHRLMMIDKFMTNVFPDDERRIIFKLMKP